MTLTEINLHDIIATFGTHEQFNNEIKEAVNFIYGFDKFNLYNIMLYYNIAFESGLDMDEDSLLYTEMAQNSIKSMGECYKSHPLRIFKFLELRIIENQQIANKYYRLKLA